MPTIEIGCGQITWSNDTPEDQVLAEIAQAGYAGAPAGPSAGRTAEQTQAVFARHGLKPAPGYLGADFWNPEQHDSILKRAREYAAFMRAVGCTDRSPVLTTRKRTVTSTRPRERCVAPRRDTRRRSSPLQAATSRRSHCSPGRRSGPPPPARSRRWR